MFALWRSKLMFLTIGLITLLAVWLVSRTTPAMNSRPTHSHRNEKPGASRKGPVLQAGNASTSTQPAVRVDDPLQGVLANPPKPADSGIAGLAIVSKPMHDRISRYVYVLKAESPRDSVANLSSQAMFQWPGAFRGNLTEAVPVPKECDRPTVERILSCRRFLKVIDEIAGIPRHEAACIIADQINTSLAKYVKAYDAEWNELLAKRRSNPQTQTRSFAAGFENSYSDDPEPDGSPNLFGLRLQLLSLTMVAGNLGLSSAKAAVLSVLEEACRQRACLYAESDALLVDRAVVLNTASLYNRQILATGILGTSGQSLSTVSSAKDNRWEKRRLTKYDAADTPYDMLTRSNGPIPPDFSKGEIFVRFHGPLDDQGFDRLVKEVKGP
jgi:hypothetical protein